MLPKPYRLPGHRILGVLKSSLVFHSHFLTIKILKKDQGPSQIGFIVSAKTRLPAVGRNKLKRRLRQAFLPLLPRLKPSHEIIILAKPLTAKKSLSVIKTEIVKLLQSCSLLN